MVSYDEKECEIWLASKGSTPQEKQGYGVWLRAIPFNLGKTPFMIVLGFGDGLGGSVTQKSVAQLGTVKEIPPVAP